MIRIQKRHGRKCLAYRLDSQNPALRRLIESGSLIPRPDGRFEVMSREAVHGQGELAEAGDYVKIDSQGQLYPNSAAFFEANHRPLGNDEYEQIPHPLQAWTAEEDMCEEVRFLIQNKGLVLDEAHPSTYFSAPLWGTLESAARDAVVVFYRIERDRTGAVVDADFNFVARDVFVKEYEILSCS